MRQRGGFGQDGHRFLGRVPPPLRLARIDVADGWVDREARRGIYGVD